MWHAKGTGQHTIGTPNTMRRQCRLYDPIGRFLNGIGWADLSTGGFFAVHADYWDCLRRGGTIGVLQVDHGYTAVRVAFGTGVVARLAANTARRIDKKLHPWIDHAAPFSRRTAQTLNAGILEIGSRARMVRRLAER